MSQQYFTVEKKFKIAGNLITDMGPEAAMNFIQVNPEAVQGFYNFVPVDGTLPIDRLAMANMWKDIMMQMRSIPPLLLQYDLGRIFAHIAQLMGVRNIGQFKLQLGTPGGLAQQADAGNLIGIPGNGAAGPPGPGGGTLPKGVPSSGMGGNAARPSGFGRTMMDKRVDEIEDIPKLGRLFADLIGNAGMEGV